MARLKRKKPTTTKKKQKAAARPDSRQLTPEKQKGGVQSGSRAPEPNRTALPRTETARAIKPAGRTLKPAFVAKSIQFLREVKVELKKVTWPSRKEAAASTVVVIIIVIIISGFLGLVDMGLSKAIRLVLG